MEINLSSCLNQCGLLQAQINALECKGYLTMTNFSLNLYSDIDSFVKKLQALPVAQGRVHMHVIWLKAFLYWLKNQICHGINIYYNYDKHFGQV